MAEDTIKSHTGLIAVFLFVGGLLWIYMSQRTPTKKPTVADAGDSLSTETPTSFVTPSMAAPNITYNLGEVPSREAYTLPTIAPRNFSTPQTTTNNSGGGSCSGCGGCKENSCASSAKVVSPTTFFKALTPEYVSSQALLLPAATSPAPTYPTYLPKSTG